MTSKAKSVWNSLMTFSKLFNEVHFYKSNFRFIVKTKVSNLQIQTVHCSSWRRNFKKEIQEKIKKICRDNLLKMPLVLASYFRTINWSLKIAKDDTLIRSLRFSWSWCVARFGTICTILKTWKHSWRSVTFSKGMGVSPVF